jgi:hypothetical protein
VAVVDEVVEAVSVELAVVESDAVLLEVSTVLEVVKVEVVEVGVVEIVLVVELDVIGSVVEIVVVEVVVVEMDVVEEVVEVVEVGSAVPFSWYMLRKFPLPQVSLEFPPHGFEHEERAAGLLAAFIVFPQ